MPAQFRRRRTLINKNGRMRKKIVIGNWKMNGSLSRNAELLGAIAAAALPEEAEVAVCPPFPYLQQCRDALQGTSVGWGAQDVSEHECGAFTGEVAVSMLLDLGCRYAIVGHSERRAMHGETDDLVARKAQVVLAAGLVPVVCVGETLEEREAGLTHAVVLRQLDAVLDLLGNQSTGIVLAYEPVWAIGTGKTATPSEAQAVHAQLRLRLVEVGAGDVPILYGGSVKPDNAGELFQSPDIDGGLIGGAALKSGDFLNIVAAV